MIGILNRKLLRDVWGIRGQAVAIGMVMGAGVAMFIMYLSTFESLRLTQRTYYERYRFADVFGAAKRAPLRLQERIAEIPGVKQAETRVVIEVTLDVPGLSEPAVGRLISVPEIRRKILNDVFLRKGRYIQPDRPDEVLVGEAFALAHDLEPGATVDAVINGRRRKLDIVGIALSPEHVYSIRAGELIPDNRHFGVFWMGRRALAAAFDMEGGFNDLVISLAPGASPQPVIDQVDQLLKPYGGLGAIPRSLQLSNWFLSAELEQLQAIGFILPIVFLLVAAFLLNVVLTRTVNVQREQIAALKAIGYSNAELGWHYAKWSLVIGLVGAAVGTAGGSWMGSGMTSLYNAFYRFPVLEYHLSAAVVAQSLVVSLAAALLGAVNAVRSAVVLPPAEAMRPEPPASYRETMLERIGLKRFVSQSGRMILRNIQRRPGRALVSVVGVACGAAMLILGTFFLDSMDVLMDVQFNVMQRQDVSVSFIESESASALHESLRLPGVFHAEKTRSLAARLRFQHRNRQVGIIGLPADSELTRVVDTSLEKVYLPSQGLVLSTKLAELLGVREGDLLTVEVLEGRRPVTQVVVADLVEEYLGINAYMEVESVNRLLGEGKNLTGVHLLVDSAEVDDLYRRLKSMPLVAGVTLKRAALQSFKDTLAETLNIMIFFNVLFAATIAFGVVYNAARISLAERSRELASLRVIGFTRAEISMILLGELALLVLVAIPIGLLLGYGAAVLIVSGLSTELYRFPAVVSTQTYALAAITILAAGMFSGLVVRRKLDHLDLVAVLKTRE